MIDLSKTHPVNRGHLIVTAELWAKTRQEARPTGPDDALDGDMILCALALELAAKGHTVVVATTNTKHLVRFVTAHFWDTIVT